MRKLFAIVIIFEQCAAAVYCSYGLIKFLDSTPLPDNYWISFAALFGIQFLMRFVWSRTERYGFSIEDVVDDIFYSGIEKLFRGKDKE